ncbi:MAG TPA: DUF4202 domain-containing protein [Nannocystaceae bacterium]|nr:DUF4202 domain-containing protein [Nannocystaceae bacterium]
MTDDERFAAAQAAFAGHHAADPRVVVRDGVTTTVSLDYHARVSAWLVRLDPEAPLVVRLAALAQHVRRWEVPRARAPAGLAGYKRWRSQLARRQADIAAAELARIGYDAATIARVEDILVKTRLRSDPHVQLLEDAVCLRFLADDLAAFVEGRADDEVVRIIRKTWDKMSPRGRDLAQALVPTLPERAAALVARALC